MGEGDQKRVEGVQVTAKSPIQAIKQQKGFLKNTAARPSPSGKPNSRPGSAGSQYKREGSPSVLQAGIVKNEYNPSTSKPTSRLFAKAIQESVRPPSRPTSAAAADPPPAREEPPAPVAIKPEHQDQVKHEDVHNDNGKRRPSPNRSRSRSRSRSPDNGKRHKKEDEKDRHNSSSPEYSRSPSPRNPSNAIHPSGRDSAEEGEWREQRVEERDDRGGGDRYREKRRSRSPSRSRSRDRRHRDRHGRSYRDRKYRGRDDRGYDRHRRGRSTSRERRRRKYTPSRSRSRSRDEYEDHRRGRRGGGDRDGGYDDHRRRGYEERDRRAGGGGRGGGRRSPSRERQDRRKPADLRGSITVAATAGASSGVLVGQQQQQQYAPPQVQQQQQPTQLPPYYQGQPPLPPLQPQPQQHIPLISVYQQQQHPYQHHQYPYQQQQAYSGAQRPPPFPLSRPPQIAPPPPPLAPPPPPLEQEQLARREPFEEKVYPPLGPPPPSPDVSKYLIEMTSAYNEEFSPTRGLVDPEKFCTALLHNNIFREESHIWAAQQAQQEMLLAILDGYDPDPFDEVSERLGLRQPLPLHRVPPHAIQTEVDKWAARQQVAAMPFEALKPPPDPRQLLPAEYKAVKEWARRPLRVPPMKIKQRPEDEAAAAAAAAAGDGGGGDRKNVVLKSSVSWSQSPSRDYGGEPEVATIKKEIKKEPSQPPLGPGSRRPSSAALATGSRFDDVLNAPSAPRHDASYPHSATRSIQRPGSAGATTGSGSASLLKMQQPMDLDEGRFQINLPDGSVPETKQYSQLLEYVSRDKPVPEGKVPPGWPVYREEDQLWVPLRDLSMTLDDFEVTRVKDAVVPNTEGAQVIAAVWDTSRDGLKKERKSSSMEFLNTIDEEGRKEINAVAGGSGQFYRVQNSVVIGGEEQRSKKCDIAEKEEPSSAAYFKEADPSAARAVGEALEKRKLERKKGAISTYAAPAHAVAAVHGALLANRDTIKIAATSVLQHALKIVIEQQQAEKKLKISSEKTSTLTK